MGALLAATAGASCTLLVQFHDEPDAGDACAGAFCEDATAPIDGGADGRQGDDGGPEDTGSVGPGRDAARDAGDGGADHYAPCRALANGYYCGDDGLHGYAGSPGDLVYCVDGGIAKVTSCDGGCVDISDPFPDSCNPCVGVANGDYCGRQLPGFPAVNADFLIDCTSGSVSLQDACAHGCDSKGTTSSCFP